MTNYDQIKKADGLEIPMNANRRTRISNYKGSQSFQNNPVVLGYSEMSE